MGYSPGLNNREWIETKFFIDLGRVAKLFSRFK